MFKIGQLIQKETFSAALSIIIDKIRLRKIYFSVPIREYKGKRKPEFLKILSSHWQ